MRETAEEIGAFEAKTKLSALLAEVEKGKIFYITKHGRRIAEMRPVSAKRPRRVFGRGKGTVRHMAPDFDAPIKDFREYT